MKGKVKPDLSLPMTDLDGKAVVCCVCNKIITLGHDADGNHAVSAYTKDKTIYYHLFCGSHFGWKTRKIVAECIKYGGLSVMCRTPDGKANLHADISRTTAKKLVKQFPNADIFIQRDDERTWITPEVLMNDRLWKTSKRNEQCLTTERQV